MKEDDLAQASIDLFYGKNAKKRAQKGTCLAYNGFVQALVDIASKVLPDTNDEKLLVSFLFFLLLFARVLCLITNQIL